MGLGEVGCKAQGLMVLLTSMQCRDKMREITDSSLTHIINTLAPCQPAHMMDTAFLVRVSCFMRRTSLRALFRKCFLGISKEIKET